MNISELIIELLQQGQDVELSGIGTLESVMRNAYHDPSTNTYYPASRVVKYSDRAVGSDAIVAELAKRECISTDVARQMWRNYTEALVDKLQRTGSHEFGKVCKLSFADGRYNVEMKDGVALEAAGPLDAPLEGVNLYSHANEADPFAKFDTPAPAPAPTPEPEPIAPEPEPVPVVPVKEEVAPVEAEEAVKAVEAEQEQEARIKLDKKAAKEEMEAAKEAQRLAKEEQKIAAERAAAELRAAEERRKAEEAERKAAEKREQAEKKAAEKAAALQARADEKAKAQASKQAAAEAKAAKKAAKKEAKQDGKKRRHTLLWLLLLLLLLLLLGAAAYYYFVLKNKPSASVASQPVRTEHLDVPAANSLTYNTDAIEYSNQDMYDNSNKVCAFMADYVRQYLADRHYTSAYVPMLEKVRQYADERMSNLLGDRFAVQRIIPYNDYIYNHCKSHLKGVRAGKARVEVQTELMDQDWLDKFLEQMIEEMGLQPDQQYAVAMPAQKTAAPAAAAPVAETKESTLTANMEKESKQGFDVIAGFFLNRDNAVRMTARLHSQGCDAYIIEKSGKYYVSMGSAPTRTAADALYKHIKGWYDGDIVIKQW